MPEPRQSTLTIDPDYQPGVIAPPPVTLPTPPPTPAAAFGRGGVDETLMGRPMTDVYQGTGDQGMERQPPPTDPAIQPTPPGSLPMPATDPSAAMLYAGGGLGPPAPSSPGFLQALGGDISDIAKGIWAAGPGTVQKVWEGGELQPGSPEFNQAAANTALTYGTLSSPFGMTLAPEGEAVAGMFGGRRWMRPRDQRGDLAPTEPPAPQLHPGMSVQDQIQATYVQAFGTPMEESLRASLSNITSPGWQEAYLRRLQDHLQEHGPSPAHANMPLEQLVPQAQRLAADPLAQQPFHEQGFDPARPTPLNEQQLAEEARPIGDRPPQWWRDHAARMRQLGMNNAAQFAESAAQRAEIRQERPGGRLIGGVQTEGPPLTVDFSDLRQQLRQNQESVARMRQAARGYTRETPPSTTGLRLERNQGEIPHGSSVDSWNINNAEGERVGYVHITQGRSREPVTVGRNTQYPKGTKHLKIEMIGSFVRNQKGAWEGAVERSGGAGRPQYGSFGPTEIRQLIRELRREYKEGKNDPPVYVDGLRIGGVRGRADKSAYLTHKIPLQSGIPLPPIPLDASDEDIERIVSEATAKQDQQQ